MTILSEGYTSIIGWIKRYMARHFWLQWLAATILGTGIGWILDIILIMVIFHPSGRFVIFVTGLGIGIAQWFVLRRWGMCRSWWVWLNGLVWCVGLILRDDLAGKWMYMQGVLWYHEKSGAVIGVAGGTLLGLILWAHLRQKVSRAGWLVPVSAISWGLGWAAGMYTIDFSVGAVAGAIAGILTGITLDWMLRHPKDSSTSDCRA